MCCLCVWLIGKSRLSRELQAGRVNVTRADTRYYILALGSKQNISWHYFLINFMPTYRKLGWDKKVQVRLHTYLMLRYGRTADYSSHVFISWMLCNAYAPDIERVRLATAKHIWKSQKHTFVKRNTCVALR